jgi:hypothetical protein
VSAEGSSSSVAAPVDDADPQSAARLMSLQQQVASLQEQLEVVTRDKTSLQGRLTHARSVLAAARCSTPSSLCSSRLPSPQPCFSPLRPLYGVSLCFWLVPTSGTTWLINRRGGCTYLSAPCEDFKCCL